MLVSDIHGVLDLGYPDIGNKLRVSVVMVNNQRIRNKCMRGCYSQEEKQSKEMSVHKVPTFWSNRCTVICFENAVE